MFAATASAGSITLKPRASVSGAKVTLDDVADLEGDSAEKLADTELVTFEESQPSRSLTMGRVRRALNKRDVHWGLLLLRGAARVEVHRAERKGDASSRSNGSGPGKAASGSLAPNGVPSQAAGRASANPLGTVDAGQRDVPDAKTLRTKIVEWVRAQLDEPAGNVKVRFVDGTGPLLNAPLTTSRFELQPLTSHMLGRVPLKVRRYQNGGHAGTQRVRLQVEVKKLVVVAAESIGRGETIGREAVERKRAWIDSRQTPVADPSKAIGQRARGRIPRGRRIHPDDLQPPVLIERGQLVTVRCISGSLVVKTVARAEEDGGRGQRIELENERTRQTFRATVTGPQEATVQGHKGGAAMAGRDKGGEG